VACCVLAAPIISQLCRMLLEAAPFIMFTMSAAVACCALSKPLGD